MNGSPLKNSLESVIDYANKPYASIEITSVGTETASLIPAAGTYRDRYKTNDDPPDFLGADGLEIQNLLMTKSSDSKFIHVQLNNLNTNTYKNKIQWYLPCKTEFDLIKEVLSVINEHASTPISKGNGSLPKSYFTSTCEFKGLSSLSGTITIYNPSNNSYGTFTVSTFNSGTVVGPRFFRPIASTILKEQYLLLSKTCGSACIYRNSLIENKK